MCVGVCVCVCVCACVRACVRACVCVCVEMQQSRFREINRHEAIGQWLSLQFSLRAVGRDQVDFPLLSFSVLTCGSGADDSRYMQIHFCKQ